MGEAALIDTHVLLWLVAGAGPASPIRDDVARGETPLVVSSVSAFEIALKVRLGRLDIGRPVVARWDSVIRDLLARQLPVTAAHGLVAGSLDWDHGDPFDRLLVAQAQVEGLTLVTADRAVLRAPDVDLLPW